MVPTVARCDESTQSCVRFCDNHATDNCPPRLENDLDYNAKDRFVVSPMSLCLKFLEPKRGVGPGPRKMGPGWTRVGLGGTRVGSLRVLFFLRNIEIAGPCGSLRVPCGSLVSQANARAGPCGSPFLWVLHHTPFGLYNVN